jgi:hypothetical protein
VQLALPLAPGAVRFHPVSQRVGASINDDPELIAPVELAEFERVAPKPKKRAAGGSGEQLDLF